MAILAHDKIINVSTLYLDGFEGFVDGLQFHDIKVDKNISKLTLDELLELFEEYKVIERYSKMSNKYDLDILDTIKFVSYVKTTKDGENFTIRIKDQENSLNENSDMLIIDIDYERNGYQHNIDNIVRKFTMKRNARTGEFTFKTKHKNHYFVTTNSEDIVLFYEVESFEDVVTNDRGDI